MAWTIEVDPRAGGDLKKLDRTVQRKIADYLSNRIATAEHPRGFGKPPLGNKYRLWRYRVGDYRMVCRLQDSPLVGLVVKVRLDQYKAELLR